MPDRRPATARRPAAPRLAMRPERARAARGPAVSRLALETAAVGIATLAYLWLFRRYGFDLVDEGTLLAQIGRVAGGERPYFDFETGYTPGFFAFWASLWRLAGSDLLATRTTGLLLHSATVAAVYGCVRAWTSGGIAACTALSYVAFLLPVSMRFGAHFNVPYPGWLVAPLVLAAQVLVASGVRGRGAQVDPRRRDRLIRLCVAGLACGAAFAVKPNAGVLALGASALATSMTWSGETKVGRMLGLGLRVAAVAGAALVLGPGMDPGYAAALFAPVVAVLWRAGLPTAFAESDEGRDTEPFGSPLGEIAALLAGFALVTLPWVLPLAAELGLGRFAREVLLLDGGGVVAAYLLPFPEPSLATLVILAGLGFAAALARGPGAAAAPALAAAGVVASAPFLETPLRVASENLVLWLGPAALLAGILTVPRRSLRERALLAFAAIYQLTLFPRPDAVHLAQSAPPVLLAGAVAWYRLVRSWRLAARGGGRRRSVPRVRVSNAVAIAAAAAVVIACVARMAPALVGRLTDPLATIDLGSHGSVLIAEAQRAELDQVATVARTLAEQAPPGAPVFTFPDLAGLGFLADRPPASYYLYFVPGRPDRNAQARVVAELESRTPPVAVAGEPHVTAFAGAETYFEQIDNYLTEHYEPAKTVGQMRILTRR